MSIEPDLLVVSGSGQPIAAVEVKMRPHLAEADATAIRRNLFLHGVLAPIDYVLIVSQEFGYLWGPGKRQLPEAKPDLKFSMLPVLQRYGFVTGGRTFPSQLELLVASWVQELVSSPKGTSEPELSLERAHFLSALQNCHVLSEARL